MLSSKNHPTRDGKKRRLLVIATAPRSEKYVAALWSELECFTLDVDHVVLSGPPWSKELLNTIVTNAQASIPQFQSQQVGIEAKTYKNHRYDVGLWCDGLEHAMGLDGDMLEPKEPEYDEYGLLNDSVFALKPYQEILRTLETKNVSMSSLSYSYYGPRLQGYGPEHYWLESVWRGFNQEGIQKFMDYSCRYAGDPLFCPLKKGWEKKKCIIDNFERAMAHQFDRNQTWGLFLSDVLDKELKKQGLFKTWVMNAAYWNKMVTEDGFPAAKVNQKDQIKNYTTDERLQTCTQYLDWSSLQMLDFSGVQKK